MISVKINLKDQSTIIWENVESFAASLALQSRPKGMEMQITTRNTALITLKPMWDQLKMYEVEDIDLITILKDNNVVAEYSDIVDYYYSVDFIGEVHEMISISFNN